MPPWAVPPADRETTLHLVAAHPDGQRVAWQRLTVKVMTYYGANIAEAAATVGWTGPLLRRLAFEELPPAGEMLRFEVAWQLDVTPAHQVWIQPQELPPPQRAWAEAALKPAVTPWFQPKWAAQTLAWLDAELSKQGLSRAGPPKTRKHWQISALWEVPTVTGRVFLKAVPTFFDREVEWTPLLSRELRGAAPSVLAADRERGLLLLGDRGDPPEQPDLVRVMTHLAQVQQASLGLPLGTLRDRGPEFILLWLERLLSDDLLLVGQEGGFTPAEAERLRATHPALVAALERLAHSPIPRTVGHGDLHNGNLLEQDGQLTFLDWSDICRTHPFLDANPAYFAPWGSAADQAALAQAQDAYLAQWHAYASPDELRGLFADALQVGELFRALGYVDGIQAHVADKTEWHDAHLDHLRKLLP